jgi:hypothetical protein
MTNSEQPQSCCSSERDRLNGPLRFGFGDLGVESGRSGEVAWIVPVEAAVGLLIDLSPVYPDPVRHAPRPGCY